MHAFTNAHTQHNTAHKKKKINTNLVDDLDGILLVGLALDGELDHSKVAAAQLFGDLVDLLHVALQKEAEREGGICVS